MVNRQGCCTLFQPHSGSLYRTYEFDDPDENGFVQIHSCMCEPENFKEQCGLPETIDVPKEILTESDQSFVNRFELFLIITGLYIMFLQFRDFK